MSFDSYHKWLGIPPENQPPHYYQLLGISVKEQDADVIQTAAQRQRSSIEDHLHGPHHREATQLIYEIEEAELTLLSPELREDYDQRVKLVLKRQKSKQSGRNLDPDSNRPAGEGSGLMRRFFGITSVILIAFLIMAYFAYQRPRTEEEKRRLQAQPISFEKKPALAEPVAKINDSAPSPPTAPAPVAKTQAEAVEWVFSVGGKVKIKNGNGIELIERVADLPSNAYRVYEVDLNRCEIDDASLQNLLPITEMESIILNSTPITDQSFAVINQLTNLKLLHYAGSKVTGKGLAQLNDQLKLIALYVNNLDLEDEEALKFVVQYPDLKYLSLAETSVTGRTLAAITSLNNLEHIQIHQTKIEDKDLEQLQTFPQLKQLLLGSPLISEKTLLETVQNLNQLNELRIYEVVITDAGTTALANMKNLTQIQLIRTQITDANVNRLKQALPDAKILVEK